jgi:predicted lactoylglutathione lyase
MAATTRPPARDNCLGSRPHPAVTSLIYVCLGVADLTRSRAFYQTVLPTLGIETTGDDRKALTFGGRFTIYETTEPTENALIAFTAGSFEAVHAFHRAGIEGGYREVEPPKVRGDRVTAALNDPDQNVVEAVHRL